MNTTNVIQNSLKTAVALLWATNSLFAESVFEYQSAPQFENVIYIDLDSLSDNLMGDTTVANNWINYMLEPLVDIYYPFRVNITTDSTVYNATPVGKRVKVYQSVDSRGGGTTSAYFGATVDFSGYDLGDRPHIYIRSGSNDPAVVYRNLQVVPHELGHTFAVEHDGCPDGISHDGCGPYYMQMEDNWVPLMGVATTLVPGYSDWFVHFYNGYKPTGGRTEDDIAIIGAVLGFRDDDIDTIDLVFGTLNDINSSDNRGAIESQTDKDYFRFSTNGGDIHLEVAPFLERFSPLYIQATIIDELGNKILIGTHKGNLGRVSVIDGNLRAGTYLLEVDGVGYAIDGSFTEFGAFTDYSSHGRYSIEGDIDAVSTIDPLTASNQNTIFTARMSGRTLLLSNTFESGRYEILKINGQIIQTGVMKKNSGIITLHNSLSSSSYILRVVTKNMVYSTTIIKD